MAIAENLLLLALENDGTEPIARLRLESGLAAAVLVDLLEQGRIGLEGETVVVREATGVGHPEEDAALERIGVEEPHDLEWWVRSLRPGLLEAVRARLVEQGILTEEHRKRLGIFPTTDRHLADPAPTERLRARVGALATGDSGAEDRPEDVILLALAHGTGLDRVRFPSVPPEQIEGVLSGRAGGGLSGVVAEAIRKVTAAVIVASTSAST